MTEMKIPKASLLVEVQPTAAQLPDDHPAKSGGVLVEGIPLTPATDVFLFPASALPSPQLVRLGHKPGRTTVSHVSEGRAQDRERRDVRQVAGRSDKVSR